MVSVQHCVVDTSKEYTAFTWSMFQSTITVKDWQRLGTVLGVTKAVLAFIDRTYSYNPKRCIMEVVKSWANRDSTSNKSHMEMYQALYIMGHTKKAALIATYSRSGD